MQKINKQRDSSIELFRVITMLIIVAHHYVVNSGITAFATTGEITWRNVFTLIFGWGGKTGINCFVLITGYFMCKSAITWKKFLKLFLEIEFYTIIIYFVFVLTGYSSFSLGTFMKAVLPIHGIGSGFTHSFLVFYLLIPFLNILIQNMNEKQHQLLLILCFVVFTVIPTFLFVHVTIGYVGWFSVIYFYASYIRMYPKKIFENKRFWGIAAGCCVLISWASVIAEMILRQHVETGILYYFVSDSNKLLALVTAICSFMFFKNLNMGYSKVVNMAGASAFGVLLIHSNSDAMRTWLWQDVLQNQQVYHSEWFLLHAVGSVAAIYVICTCIDILRIKLVEQPFFGWLEKRRMK